VQEHCKRSVGARWQQPHAVGTNNRPIVCFKPLSACRFIYHIMCDDTEV